MAEELNRWWRPTLIWANMEYSMRVICRAISSSSMSKKLRLGEYRLRGTFGVGGACANIRSSFFGSADVYSTGQTQSVSSRSPSFARKERSESESESDG